MTEKKILFKNKNGLHARPSAQVVAITSAYPKCRCFLINDGNKINAKSILNLIINAIPAGRYLTIQAEGEGEKELVEKLSAYLEQEVLSTEDNASKNNKKVEEKMPNPSRKDKGKRAH